MKAKLTLQLEEALIQEAKKIAATQGKSVSKMVEDFFAVLIKTEAEPKPTKNSPTVQALRGLLEGTGADEKEYFYCLDKKHTS